MTLRAVLVGFIGAAFFCGFGYFNDAVMHQTMLIGSNMPISVYGGLILFMLLVHPLLRRWSFTGRELAVALAIILASCCIPGSGLMRSFTAQLMMPHHFAKTNVGWRTQGVIEMTPPRMLADASGDEDIAVNGFVQGAHKGWSLRRIPWHAWTGTLAFWLPMILTFWVGLIGLSVVTHRQWADHEHLPYPLATFAAALLPEEQSQRVGVLRNRLFWLGAGVVLFVHVNNYACGWFPRHMVAIPTEIDMGSLRELFPLYVKKGGGGRPFHPQFYFTVVAFAYFLASDVSFSLGFGPYVYPLVVGVFAVYGVSLRAGGAFSPSLQTFLNFGAYSGAMLALVYSGRHYFGRVFRQAVFLPSPERVEGEPVWGARVFLVCAGMFAVSLMAAGLDWPLALLYTAMAFMLMGVVGRIIAETGMFMIQPYWYPCVILLGLFGRRAIAPRDLLVMMLITMVLLLDPREALMPFLTNSWKLLQLRKVKIGKPAVCCGLALFVGLAVAIPVVLGFQYDLGVNTQDGWGTRSAPQIAFDQVVIHKQRLQAQGTLERARSARGLKRFAAMAPMRSCMAAFAIGCGLFVLFTAARLRFTRWFLHPVLFLVWNSWPGIMLSSSFLLGWFIKVMVTKYGGAGVYQKLKPLMLGAIAGEMVGGVVPMLVGLVYYLATSEPPAVFNILPG